MGVGGVSLQGVLSKAAIFGVLHARLPSVLCSWSWAPESRWEQGLMGRQWILQGVELTALLRLPVRKRAEPWVKQAQALWVLMGDGFHPRSGEQADDLETAGREQRWPPLGW